MNRLLVICLISAAFAFSCKKDSTPAKLTIDPEIELEEQMNGEAVSIDWDNKNNGDSAYVLRSVNAGVSFDTIAIVSPFYDYTDSTPVYGATNYYKVMLWSKDAGFSDPTSVASINVDNRAVELVQIGSPGTGLGQFNICHSNEYSQIAYDGTYYYVLDGRNYRIQRFDQHFKAVDFITYNGGTSWVAGKANFTPNDDFFPACIQYINGHIYVLDLYGNCGSNSNYYSQTFVLKFTLAGQLVASIALEDGFGVWSGMVIDQDDNIYMFDDYVVQKHNSSGARIAEFGSYGTGTGQFLSEYDVDMKIDSEQNLYVSDPKSEIVQKFNAAGNYIASFSFSGEIYNNCLAEDNGSFYLLIHDGSEFKTYLKKFGPDGSIQEQWRVPFDLTYYPFDVKNGLLFTYSNEQTITVSEMPASHYD